MAKSRKRAESRARAYIRYEAEKRGWNLKHVGTGGDLLEENEITAQFKNIGLGLDKPDFLFCLGGEPSVVVEAKNERDKAETALNEAIEYAEATNATGKYCIKIAVGAAGEEDCGFTVYTRYLRKGKWLPLTSKGFEITTIPSKAEVELALEADDATTSVSVPSSAEFIDAAIELSVLLRKAKVEAPLRPKVIGAIVLAMYHTEIDSHPDRALESINVAVAAAIDESVDLDLHKKQRLKDALGLTGNDYDRLAPHIARIVALLRRLNVRAVLQTDTDFLGLFYEAFLRYGYDNNALGIVFTPRHITRFCVDLTEPDVTDRVIDLACGTGGFLVAAFDRMLAGAKGPKAILKVKQSLFGFDTNPTIWALASLNMFFRGDGRTHIENITCFDTVKKASVALQFSKAYLNPPFSQEGEPERDFIDASMAALEPEGTLAVVVKAGIFADDDNAAWRAEFTRNHTVLGLISLPDDLFYPTAAPTTLLLAKAHIPQPAASSVVMARIWNDGFVKLKTRRVEATGSQLPEILTAFDEFRKGKAHKSEIVVQIAAQQILNRAEWSPQQYLPQPSALKAQAKQFEETVVLSLYQAAATMLPLADEALEDFGELWADLPALPLNAQGEILKFFKVENGKSSGEKNYRDGTCPYISSGDSTNSIVRLADAEIDEVFEAGGITVTAFGQAYLQPWRFMARGNGGSAVRVLIPKFKMSTNELVWFAAQINLQKWRFFYGRMAIKSRLEKLVVATPKARMPDVGDSIAARLVSLRDHLKKLSKV
jgi:type I restriction enzyme M protein